MKKELYSRLVQKRKACRLCNGLINPSTYSKLDSDHIGPWSRWQSNLDTDILIVGQDWGDTSYFCKWKGIDQPHGNPTNENLQILLEYIGVHIGRPRNNHVNSVFLTNLILCLKDGGLQAPVENAWLQNCANKFFKPLVEIISPKIVIALGKNISESIMTIFRVNYKRNCKLSDLLKNAPYSLNGTTVLFPVYHCGAGGVNRNRSMREQLSDWSRITEYLNK